MEPVPKTAWTVESLTQLLREAGGAPGWNGLRPLFAVEDPLPPSERPGAPLHPTTPCLTWQGPDSGFDPRYGRVRIDNTYRGVHRVTFELANGPIEPGSDGRGGSIRSRGSGRSLDLAHLCERSLCARPDHMRPLTRAQHAREAAGRRYSDDLLALAPIEPCRRCGGPTTVSIVIPKAARPRWTYTCPPCTAAWFRARRKGEKAPHGAHSTRMDSEIVRRWLS